MALNPLFGEDNLLLQDTVTVSEAAATGFPTVNLADLRVWNFYKNAAATSDMDVETDAGVGKTSKVDYFMLAGHDLEDPADDGNGGVLLEFQHSDDGVVFTTIFSVTPTDGTIIARGFTQLDKRFYRARLTRAGTFVVSLGQVQWGRAVRIPGGIESTFDPDAERLVGRFNQSQVGNFLGSVIHFRQRTGRINVRLLPDSFIRGNLVSEFRDFWNNHAALFKPFLWHWNAQDTDATDVTHEDQAFFAMVDPAVPIQRPLVTPLVKGFRDLTFTVLGLGE